MNKNEIQIEGITSPPLLPPNNLLFKPKRQTEHNYFNQTHEESVDERKLFLRHITADKGPSNEKGWKIADRQPFRRPSNWLSFGFDETLDSVWSQTDAVTQLTTEELHQILEQLKQKQIDEIKIYEKGCKKRPFERFAMIFEWFELNFFEISSI